MNNISINKCPVCLKQDIKWFMIGIYDSETTDVMECQVYGLQYPNKPVIK